MQNYFEKFVSNLVFASFIPSLLFVYTIIFTFSSVIQPNILSELSNMFNGIGVFGLVCSVIISFIILYTRELIYSFYRGLFLPKIFSFIEYKRAQRMRNEIDNITHEIEEIAKQKSSPEIRKREIQLRSQCYVMVANYLSCFPAYYRDKIRYDDELLPTQLGNILRAAEYSCRSYGINAIAIWPRLVHVIPKENYEKIDEVNNQMFLLLNFSLLALLFSGLSLVMVILFLNQFKLVTHFFTLAVISFVLFYVFYRFSLPLARNYAKMYRTAFDLFRFKLLSTINEKLPGDYDEEFTTWDRICERMEIGECFSRLSCDYSNSAKLPKPIEETILETPFRSKLANVFHSIGNLIEK
ncbi:MAG: hypothetical protein HUU38_26830 [Anaerolineales bacterium]|nr:hypothetical protein [Anaerolineales bacterium]